MADIFSATNETRNKVPTTVFDWSHAVHTTTEIGRITPVFCELVPSKTSLRINAKLGFQFMPMVFPLQSRIRYRLAFFKYPLRALWTDFRDFTGNFRQDLEEPYIDFKGDVPQTGSLWDYLGLPTTFSGSFGQNDFSVTFGNPLNCFRATSFSDFPEVGQQMPSSFSPSSSSPASNYINYGYSYVSPASFGLPSDSLNFKFVRNGGSVNNWTSASLRNVAFVVCQGLTILAKYATYSLLGYTQVTASPDASGGFTVSLPLDGLSFRNDADLQVFVLLRALPSIPQIGTSGNGYVFYNDASFSYTPIGSDVQPLTADTNPYYDSSSNNKSKQLKISAYAARSYEGVYNSWFRDNRNNPYYLDGQVEYNKWIPNYNGGADPASNYQLRYANWERDFLTTAVQTPQQGIAPLVGITTYEDTVTLEDGTVRTVNKVAITDEDGKSYKIGFDSDENGLKGVSYQPLDDTQVAKSTSLIQLAQSGISIADLRNVNAYQRYLELNIRAGYSYKDIIEHRFDVRIGYNELLMPEFIGGMSDWVEMHSVTQTVMKEDNGTYADALGSQAGIAGARKYSETINCFCDEESIILGVLVFTPVPIYTQLLPKHFLYRGLLDHFAPEFANIGFQPILMREVAPVQQWNADNTKMLDTFGYNRAWYELCQKQDTAHGLYRTQLRNFIMNRVFNQAPALNQSFLLVDPQQVNDVFAVTETTDKIYGQIYFDAKVKLPIPRVAIPRLE